MLRSGHKELALLTLFWTHLKALLLFSSSVMAAAREAALLDSAGSWSLFSCVAAFCRRKRCGDRHGCHHCCCSFYRIDNGSDMAACAAFTRIPLFISGQFFAAGLFVSFGPENSGMAQITVWGLAFKLGTHKQNIQRILSGEESKISFRKNPSD